MFKKSTRLVSIILVMILVVAMSVSALAESSRVESTISAKKNIPERFVATMKNMGYTDNELENMNRKEIINLLKQRLSYKEIKNDTNIQANSKNDIITDDSGKIILFASYTMPSNFVGVVVPGDGSSLQYFHPDTNMNSSTIQSAVDGAANAARYIFNRSNETLRSNYFLWGEFDSGLGTHKGIDLQNLTTPTANVRSAVAGVVSKSSTSGKYVNIAMSNGKTMNYQHLNNITGSGLLAEGNTVNLNQFLGNQNTTDKHVHVQVCAHSNCTAVHSSTTYTTLETVSPYSSFPQY